MKKNQKLAFIVIMTLVLIILGGWFYFGWYKSEKQIIARCHKNYVVTEGDYYKARDGFYDCLSKNGFQGYPGDGRFQWDKPSN